VADWQAMVAARDAGALLMSITGALCGVPVLLAPRRARPWVVALLAVAAIVASEPA